MPPVFGPRELAEEAATLAALPAGTVIRIGAVSLTVNGAGRVVAGGPLMVDGANDVVITSAAAGSSPSIAAEGADPNVPLTVSGKGTGPVVLNNADVNGGTIDGTPIGGTVPAAVTATTLTTTSGTNAFDAGGNPNGATLALSSRGTGATADLNINLLTLSSGPADPLGSATSKGWTFVGRSNGNTAGQANCLLWSYWSGTNWNEFFRLSPDGSLQLSSLYTASATGGSKGAGTVNATGLFVNGVNALDGSPLGATNPAAGAFSALSASGPVSGAGFTNLFASPPAIGGTTPAALRGTTLALTGSLPVGQVLAAPSGAAGPPTWRQLASGDISGLGTLATANAAAPPALGTTTPAGGAFSTLSASGTVSGAGFTTFLAAPPAIGGTTPAAITGTTVNATSALQVAGVAQQAQPAFSRPALASWTTTVQGTATPTDVTGGPLMLRLPSQANVNAYKGLFVTAPATPYTVTALLRVVAPHQGGRSAGLFLRTAGGAIRAFSRYGMIQTNQVYDGCNVDAWTSNTAYGSNVKTVLWAWGIDAYWLRITNDGTNIQYHASASGYDWIRVYTETVTTAGSPTQVGFGANNADTVSDGIDLVVSLLDWQTLATASPTTAASRARM